MRRAFTLVEILVAIGVILLLVSLAAPALGIARARADSARCVSHLRSLGAALNLYLADHAMIMPDIASGRADRAEEVPVIDTTLDAYVDTPAVFICPSGRAVGEKSGTSYYWNSALRGQSVAALKLFWLEDPGRIPVLLDKEGWHRYVDDKVNHLFADGHVTNDLRMIVE